MKTKQNNLVFKNKKAFHDYEVLSKLEAGIVLKGTEIKSIRKGELNLKDSFCVFIKGELFIEGMHISTYKEGNIFNHDPYRQKKLLLHKKELLKLSQRIKLEGIALVPLSVYMKQGLLKVELGVCKGKKSYDKREDLKRKDQEMEQKKYMSRSF